MRANNMVLGSAEKITCSIKDENQQVNIRIQLPTQLYHYYYSSLYQFISKIVWIQPKLIAKKVISIFT